MKKYIRKIWRSTRILFNAAEKLQLLLKYNNNHYNKEVYLKIIKEYCERAKVLKQNY